MKYWKIRISGIVILLVSVWYLLWLLESVNSRAYFISIPFLIANLVLTANTFLSIINHWKSDVPEDKLVPAGREPKVGIIIPTWGEPIDIVIRTIKSVLTVDWPRDKMIIVVSDDGHRPELKKALADIKGKTLPLIIYNEPPLKNTPERRGEGKAGNLNSAMELLSKKFPDVYFIETRDSDDLVPRRDFLRQCIGQLMGNNDAAFVQTIKECIVSEGDPFGNQEPVFYRNTMVSKYSFNASYPCGSGVVYRKSWLDLIGGFSAWNLVEDLYTGFEMYKRGGKGIYLPIVGALGQIAPEDIPNFYKQRGTWAVDALRIFFWRNPLFTKGLKLTQKLQFLELGTFYLLGPVMVIFILTVFVSLTFGIYPVIEDPLTYSIHFWPYFTAMELFLVAKADGLSYESIWRSRQTWMGLSTVFTKAFFLALLYGPNKKPSYKVTRKYQISGFYLKETAPQIILSTALFSGIIYQVYFKHSLTGIDFGSVFWAAFFILGLSKTITNSWFGVKRGGIIDRLKLNLLEARVN